ncbi:RCC1 and BTB domain-containing protein 1-like [Cloeon dipterum]|uniref:RCC1 and BTB domain-containing protein 1-like n=1 Tax=Cloeon dipterum TaxID=197152 RepID=UPI0032205997
MSKLLRRKWAYFGYQEKEIRTAIVFGSQAENVIIVLENDEVLAFGENINGCLGTGDEDEVDDELKRIEILCGQGIQGFEYSVAFVGDCEGQFFSLFAISRSGSVFSWGENKNGQLGLGTTKYTKVPTKISGSLKEKKVVQVASGGLHTLALTSGGEIIAWGANTNGMLGVSSTLSKECSPCQVIDLEVVISQIVCGPFFTLALSDDGKIYSWGENHRGQLGNGTTQFVKSPTMISTKIGRVREIAATHYWGHPCAAITQENKVYIWADYNSCRVDLKPVLTSYSSFDEVFAVANPPLIYRRFQLKLVEDQSKAKGLRVIERLRKAFDNPETADFAFIVEGKKIHVHKTILTISSDLFQDLFLAGDWEDSYQKEKIIEDHSYDAFYAFLKYFYTDEVDFTPDLALDVYSLAHVFRVADLKDECKKILKSGLNSAK